MTLIEDPGCVKHVSKQDVSMKQKLDMREMDRPGFVFSQRWSGRNK
jgi:hypothetical protein